MNTEFVIMDVSDIVWIVIYLLSVWVLCWMLRMAVIDNERLEAEISGMVEIRDSPLLLSARVEIDRLKKDNKRLRDMRDAFQREARALEGELRRIGSPSKKITFCRDGHEESVLIARAALGEGK
jgi:hypothetical protein